MTVATIETPDGVFTARFSDRGLVQLSFPGQATPASTAVHGTPLTAVQRAWLKATTREVRRALQGQPITDPPPLDTSAGTAFQQRVWAELRRIGAGQIRSYGELARRVGRPTAARAVGQACGANPIPLFIPCHRVLAANRRLGGFSAGLEWKRRLLAREGVACA
jgi:O-6-methylguanine DNA methyltransferase